MDVVRKRILQALEERGMDMKSLSLAMGRNEAYIHQFVNRGIPAELKERDRKKVAAILSILESELGAPVAPESEFRQYRNIPEYSVQASAGHGAVVSSENVIAHWPLAEEYLNGELKLTHARLAIIEVRGDSMEPTIRSGDRVLVNLNDTQVSQPGIFVLLDGDGLVVKRVEKIPAKNLIVLISDNPLHTRYEVPIDQIQIAGRVVWRAGRV